jgi:hypothetical protein
VPLDSRPACERTDAAYARALDGSTLPARKL